MTRRPEATNSERQATFAKERMERLAAVRAELEPENSDDELTVSQKQARAAAAATRRRKGFRS